MAGTVGQNAMVLAAGLATRMGDLSKVVPKPLVQVKGVSLIDRHRAHACRAGIRKLVVNVHHLADQMEDHLAASVKAGEVVISDERDLLLETGGGVKKALPLLGPDPFFVMNGDALWIDNNRPNLERLCAAWDPSQMDILLLLVPTDEALGYDGVGDFFASSGGVQPIRFRDDAPDAPYMYGGIQLVTPSLYDDMPNGPFSNREIFRKAFANGRLYGLPIDGHWMHVGTEQAIGEAEVRLTALGAS